MEKSIIIILDGHDGVGKSTIAKGVLSRIKGKYLRFFDEDFIGTHDFLSLSTDDKIKTAKIVFDKLSNENGTIVMDRGLMSVLSLLPQSRWDEFKSYFDKFTVLHIKADLDTILSRLKNRETDERGMFDDKHYLDVYSNISRRFLLPEIDTALEPDLEINVKLALKLAGMAQRKNIYFAGSMIIDYETGKIDLEKDYRTFLVKENEFMTPSGPIPLNNDYAYSGPRFYYLDGSGEESVSSRLVVAQEAKMISDEIDLFVAFLQEDVSAGTVAELIYAAHYKKNIHVYYLPTPSDSNAYNTNQWFPIVLAEHINPGKVKVSEVKDLNDLLSNLERDYGIKPIR
jgi:adenylylsulfate kinase-like enzyme